MVILMKIKTRWLRRLTEQLYKALIYHKCLIKYKVGQVLATKKYSAFGDQAKG